MMIKTLTEGIRQVNESYTQNFDFDLNDYRGMVVQYLLSALLIQLGEDGDCGLYEHPQSHGFIGWISAEQQTLFFAPTKVVIQDHTDTSMDNDNG